MESTHHGPDDQRIPMAEPLPAGTDSAPAPEAAKNPSAASRWWKMGTEAFLIMVVVAIGGFFCIHVLGMQVPGFASTPKEKEETVKDDKKNPKTLPGVELVKGKPCTVDVPKDVRDSLGISNDGVDIYVTAQTPVAMRPLVLPGSTMLNPMRLARIRARFQPTRVVEIGKVQDISRTGQSELRELRPGDRVRKDQVLGIFYSEIVGSKKNDLLDALTQLELDQKIYDRAVAARQSIPEVLLDGYYRAVQSDRNAVNRALNNLKVWDIPQDEIDALRDEAKIMAADKTRWSRTPEGRWVNGEKQTAAQERENPWGRVTLRAPFDGVIVERNLHVDEMIIDGTVNLFQIAEVDRLVVVANCPEDQLPILERLGTGTPWTIKTAGADAGDGLPGTVDEIGYLIDPMQHTAIIKGYVQNPEKRLRGGQYVSATVQIPPPPGVVEIPINALVDDGKQGLVFVQTDPARPQYTMRRVEVTNRFERTVFVRSELDSKLTPKQVTQWELTDQDKEEGLMSRQLLKPGERLIKSGTGELKLAVLALESQARKEKEPKSKKE